MRGACRPGYANSTVTQSDFREQDVGTTARGLLTVAQGLHSGSVECFPGTEGFLRTPDVQWQNQRRVRAQEGLLVITAQ